MKSYRWLHETLLLTALALGATDGTAARADNWPSWRGPHQDGTAARGEYPVDWGLSRNIAWSYELPGRAGSTPVVWNDRVALTCPIDGKNGVVCLQNGKRLWETTVGEEVPGKHRKGSGTNPSPVTDGERIFVYFKSGDLAALSWEGEILWQLNLQQKYGADTLWWDLGTSPVLTSQHVVVACMQTEPGPSYLAAFDRATGAVAWKVDRTLPAPEEAAQSYSTPVVATHDGQEQIVVLGADHVTCHEAATGREIWRVGGLNPNQERNYRSIASPVIADGVVIAPYARGRTLTAIRLGGTGDVTNSHVLWRRETSSDVPTPTAADGLVYICTDRGVLACLEIASGKEIWQEQLEKSRHAYSSSPVLAGNLLYVVREDATTFVVDVSDRKVVATNALGEEEFTLSTPVLVSGSVLLRTFEQLFCIQSTRRAGTAP